MIAGRRPSKNFPSRKTVPKIKIKLTDASKKGTLPRRIRYPRTIATEARKRPMPQERSPSRQDLDPFICGFFNQPRSPRYPTTRLHPPRQTAMVSAKIPGEVYHFHSGFWKGICREAMAKAALTIKRRRAPRKSRPGDRSVSGEGGFPPSCWFFSAESMFMAWGSSDRPGF